MPITQASWLTNLTENDLTVKLNQVTNDLSSAIAQNNGDINELIESQLTSVKNAIAEISNEISNLKTSMPTSLIGSTSDGYGTTTTGSVMGKLNYLIYLLAPTPATFNYSSAGTFNNITIPTGVKFISITACGGSGGGRVGTAFTPYSGKYIPHNHSYINYQNGSLYGYGDQDSVLNVSGYYVNNRHHNVQNYLDFMRNCGKYNYNVWGRRINFTVTGYTNQRLTGGDGSACYPYYNYVITNGTYFKTVQIAKNVVTAGGNAGVTASVSSASMNVATAEVVTVTVGAGGGNSASGAASTVTCSNGTKSFSGAATGAAGNTVTYSNWTTTFNRSAVNIFYREYNNGYFQCSNLNFTTAHTTPTDITITAKGSAGKTASANSLSKAGGKGGTGAAHSYIIYANGIWSNRSNPTPGAGAAGGSGYVRVAW